MAYSYNPPYDVNSNPDPRVAFSRPQIQVHVQRPQPPNGTSLVDQRSFYNVVGYNGGVPSRPQPITPPQNFWQQQMTQAQASFRGSAANFSKMNRSSNSSPYASTPAPSHTPVDHNLLLSLAEEYFAAAHDENSVGPLLKQGADFDSYFKLLSTGLGCLDAVLRNFKLLPELEARVRLRYASILFQETDNEVEDILSHGITTCDRHKLIDLKYNMQHLLTRALFAKKPTAAMKYVDEVIKTVEAYQHTIWIYAFRFLKASLSLELGGQDSVNGTSHLKIIVSIAKGHGDYAVAAAASITEALSYLHRSNNTDSIEQAQRALAAARSAQHDPAAQAVPQLASMTNFVDLCCSLQQNDSKQADGKMQPLHSTFDQSPEKWTTSGVCLIPVSKKTGSFATSAFLDGIVRLDSDQRPHLVLSYWPVQDLRALGFLLSGAGTAHKNSVDQKAEQYFHEAVTALRQPPAQKNGPLPSLIVQQVQRRKLLCQVILHLIFALCSRTDFENAKKQLGTLKTIAAKLPSGETDEIELFISYLEGIIAQGTGNLTSALSIFQNPQFSLDRPEDSSPLTQIQRDLSILSALNTIFIIRSPSHPKHNLLLPIFATLQNLCPTHSSINIHSAYNLARATAHPNDTSGIVKTKMFLQNALQAAKQTANNQLMCITLNFMSYKFFRGVVGEQAEKSARASANLAKKGRDGMWMSVATGVLSDTLEVMGKREEAEGVRREGMEFAARLPSALQREVGGDS